MDIDENIDDEELELIEETTNDILTNFVGWADVDLTKHQGSSAKEQYLKVCQDTIDNGYLVYAHDFYKYSTSQHEFKYDIKDDASLKDYDTRVERYWAFIIVNLRYSQVCLKHPSSPSPTPSPISP